MYVPRATPLALWQTFLAIDSKNIPSVRVVFGYGLGGVWRPFPQMGSYRFPLATPDLGPLRHQGHGCVRGNRGMPGPCRGVPCSLSRCLRICVQRVVCRRSRYVCVGGARLVVVAAEGVVPRAELAAVFLPATVDHGRWLGVSVGRDDCVRCEADVERGSTAQLYALCGTDAA